MSTVAPSVSPPSSSAVTIPTSSSAENTSAPSPDDAHVATTAQPSAAPTVVTDHSSPSSSGEHKLATGAGAASSGSKGKRVFVFQKRWLHSLPIMERTLPESVDVKKKSSVDEAVASPSSSPTGSSAVNESDESSRDMIACMLCDEPGSTSHHLTRVWSRMNCRRGRIENHLTSKHPEFMLLLKHKRDTEGELPVQIFLQGMREGRCSIRSEINLGLYNQIQSLNTEAASSAALASTGAAASGSADIAAAAATVSAADLAHLQQSAKRGFPGANVYTIRDSGITTSTSAADNNDKLLSAFPPAGAAEKATLELLELENRHKRARIESGDASSTANDQAAALPGAAGEARSDFHPAPALDASLFAQWHSVFYNKLVVVTGGENEFITSLATNLWLLGANVLLTFTNIAALGEFMTSHVARFPDTESSSATGATPANNRGVMLSMLCAFHTRRQIDEWSKSVADKYSRVDFLINFVDEDEHKTSSSAAQDQQQDSPPSAHQQQQGENSGSSGEFLVSSANRLLELCQSISKLCFQSSGSGSIINITTQSDGVRRSMNCAAVESMTKSLALELQPLNVQVNCILLQQISASADTSASNQQELQNPQQQDQQYAALSHTILFLLSPASTSVSGSVLRLQHRSLSSQPPAATAATTIEAAVPTSSEPELSAAGRAAAIQSVVEEAVLI